MGRSLSKHQQGEMRFPPRDPPDNTLTVRALTPAERVRYGIGPPSETGTVDAPEVATPDDPRPTEPTKLSATTSDLNTIIETPADAASISQERPKMTHKMAADRIEAMEAAFAQGLTTRQVAQQYSIPHTTVSYYRGKWGRRQVSGNASPPPQEPVGPVESEDRRWHAAFGDVAWWLAHWGAETEEPGALAHEVRFLIGHLRRTYGVDVQQEGRRES